MSNQLVDIYLADVDLWTGWNSWTHRKEAIPPPKPTLRPGVDLIVPTIIRDTWSSTIDIILDQLKPGQQIDHFYMCGHGEGGQFRIGQLLKWKDDSTIALFRQFRPFAPIWRTNVYIIGCEVAADGPCQHSDPVHPDWCLGPFGAQFAMPGYALQRKLAEAIGAPVHGSTVKLPLITPWPDQLKAGPRLTVGPDGAWVLRGGRVTGWFVRFGSPLSPPPEPPKEKMTY
jgi:hypothetical protein